MIDVAKIYELLANSVAVLHVAVIVLDCWGMLAVVRGQFATESCVLWKKLYLLLAFLKSVSLLLINDCPLTVIEHQFRQLSDPSFQPSCSFVAYYAPWVPSQIDQVIALAFMVAGLVGSVQFACKKLWRPIDTSNARIARTQEHLHRC